MLPLEIKSAQGNYPVEFPSTVSETVKKILEIPKAVVTLDRKVADLYAKELTPLLNSTPHLLLDATEEEKSWVGVSKVSNWLQGLNANKQTTLVTLGGGIVQDISSFSAHIYYRGIKWVFAPTTLLSMSDSSIGAKCGINLNAFKNQLGCFHSPAQVFICTDFTRTLSDLDMASGYGEILKLMLTGSQALTDRLEAALESGGLRNPDLTSLIRESLEVKKKVIEIDEYEADLRRILNYGHTFGHALETVTEHAVPHGLAVAWGMDLVNYISLKYGMLPQADFDRTHGLIRKHLKFSLSSAVLASDLGSGLIKASRRDKKVSDGQVNLILLERPGSLKIVKTAFDANLEANIRDYVEHWNVFRL